MFARLRIVHKLTLVNSVAIALLFLVLAIGLLVAAQSLLQAEFEKRIEQQVELVASNLGAAVLFDDWETTRELAESLLTDSAVIRVQVLDGSEDVRIDFGARDSAGAQGAISEDALHRFSSPVKDGDEVLARLQVWVTNSEVDAAIQSALPSLTALLVLVLICGVALTYRLQSYVVQPIQRLSSLVRQVRDQQDYSVRAEVAYPDEVGRLAIDVNEMLDLIRERDSHLADTVAHRTSELEVRNRELKLEIEQRQASDSALQESQLRFENAFSNAPIGMALVDSDGRLLQYNQKLVTLLGEGELAKKPMSAFVDSAYRDDLEHALELLRSNQENAIELEVAITGKDDSELTCIISGSAVRSDDGFLYSVMQIQDTTESTRLSKKLAYQATHDALTGLANRRVLESELSKANADLASGGGGFAFCLMDLDQFKVVNDTCGHSAGDALLIQVSKLIQDSVRPEDLVVRLGGDEFAVLLYKCDEDKGFQLADQIRQEIERSTFLWESDTFRVGVSIGLVTATAGSPFDDTTEILRQADTACFAAKDLGRNRVYCVSANDERIALNEGEMHWVARINSALERDEFLLYAQPILPVSALDTGPPRYEILLRLRDYTSSRLIAPGAFFSSVERYDLSVRVDRWVVRQLIRTLKAYVKLFDDQRRFWVNLSGKSLGDEKFLEELEAVIRDADLPRGMLNFEVTETAVIRNIAQASETMVRLKAFDCQFALDDFGTGLSSFGYLKSLPVDFIKIDGSFVRNIVDDEVDRMFVKSIIEIARTMGIQTVAEFVEDDQILAVLRGLGVDYGQGYGLGWPAELLPPPGDSTILGKDGDRGADIVALRKPS